MLRGRFAFDPESHVYSLYGKRYRYIVPGTTEILRAAGYYATAFYTREGRERGSAIHRLSAALDLGLVDVDKLMRLSISGYLRAFVRFKEENTHRFDAEWIEGAVVNRRLGFATHVDRAGALGGPMVLNLKTGSPSPADPVQSALELLALDGRWSPRRRYTLYLGANGRYKLVEHVNAGDERSALEALGIWRRNEHQESRHGRLALLDPVPA
jgi:hypothetical protein